MEIWLIWLLAAGVLVIAEIATLTLYLLLAAFGAFTASALAYLGVPLPAQILVAGVLTIGGCLLLKKYRPHAVHSDPRSNPDLNLDIGTVVRLTSLSPDGRIGVHLRGARWDARLPDNQTPDPTRDYVIAGIDGATLLLNPKSETGVFS